MVKFYKHFVALKYYLLGKGYHKALAALEFARKIHTGLRKDNITPEFYHQVSIGLYLSSIKDVQNEEAVLTLAFLHDIVEDYEIDESLMVQKFGQEIYNKTLKLSKKIKGVQKTPQLYFNEISEDIDCSLVKGADRVNNIQTMLGVFTKEKQEKYIKEVEDYFFPMLKNARNNFPSQLHAYFNITQMLKNQIEWAKAHCSEK